MTACPACRTENDPGTLFCDRCRADLPRPAAATVHDGPLPAGASAALIVIRGQRVGASYPLYEGKNFIGRADEKPVDIDLEDQEEPDRVWSSRQHAVVVLAGGVLTLEDLNSLNGTFVNRARAHPGTPRELRPGDVIQVGTVQLEVRVTL